MDNLYEPMLVSPSAHLIKKSSFIHEIKYDGWRCIAVIKDNQVKLYSNNGNIQNL